jgi:adenylate cyclase
MLEGPLHSLGRTEEAREANRLAGLKIERRLQLRPDDVRALLLGAVQAAHEGNADRARVLGERAMAARPDDFSTAYNVACAHAILGEHDRALELLDRAVAHGRGNLGWIERDTDFAALHGHPRFEAILARLRASAGKAGA